MFSNSRGGVPVYLRGQVTGLRSSCSVLHQVQVCCVSGGHAFRLISSHSLHGKIIKQGCFGQKGALPLHYIRIPCGVFTLWENVDPGNTLLLI